MHSTFLHHCKGEISIVFFLKVSTYEIFFFDMMIIYLDSRSEDLPQFPVDSGRYAAVRNAMTK
jgi:hypothetical protein